MRCPQQLENQFVQLLIRQLLGAYGAEMRELRRLMRVLDEEQRRVLELVK